MAERWITKTELAEHLCISGRTLQSRIYPLATRGQHYIHKDPLNIYSPKVWKLSEVEKLVRQSSSALQRRLVRKQGAAKITTFNFKNKKKEKKKTAIILFGIPASPARRHSIHGICNGISR